jgi:hypothetical protein
MAGLALADLATAGLTLSAGAQAQTPQAVPYQAPYQTPYVAPYQSPYQLQAAGGAPIASPAAVVASPHQAVNSLPGQGYPAQTYIVWYPHQVQLSYQPQVVAVPQWQLKPAEIKQPYSYMAPTYRQVTLVGYQPRLVLDTVELKAWQVDWQRQQAERSIQVWQPQLGQQQVQVWQPQWLPAGQAAPQTGP